MKKTLILDSDITLLIDTREKEYHHIEKYFIRKGIPVQFQKLDFGDYSFIYKTECFADKFSIERKNNK